MNQCATRRKCVYFPLELPQEQPTKVAVIGAGYIAVELAGVFHSLGTDTTLIVRRDKPLRSFDALLSDTLVSEMEKSGLTLKTHSITKVRSQQDTGRERY